MTRASKAGSGYSYEWRFYTNKVNFRRKVNEGMDVILS